MRAGLLRADAERDPRWTPSPGIRTGGCEKSDGKRRRRECNPRDHRFSTTRQTTNRLVRSTRRSSYVARSFKRTARPSRRPSRPLGCTRWRSTTEAVAFVYEGSSRSDRTRRTSASRRTRTPRALLVAAADRSEARAGPPVDRDASAGSWLCQSTKTDTRWFSRSAERAARSSDSAGFVDALLTVEVLLVAESCDPLEHPATTTLEQTAMMRTTLIRGPRIRRGRGLCCRRGRCRASGGWGRRL
jgi:hypothetical protein